MISQISTHPDCPSTRFDSVARSRYRPAALYAPLVLAGLIAVLALLVLAGPVSAAQQPRSASAPLSPASPQAPNRAGLVVLHANDVSVTRCVEFISPTISGLQLLDLSGLQYTDLGGFVTSIDNEACTWGGPGCWWWSYWLSDAGDGAWAFSPVGAGSRTVHPGAVDGWQAQPDGTFNPPARLPALTFADICPQAPATAALGVSKSASVASALVGDVITFTVVVSNAGPDAATGVSISDTLPVCLSDVISNTSQGLYDYMAGLWQVGSLNAGESATLSLRARLNECAAGTTVVNTARLSASAPADTTPANNQASASIIVSTTTPIRTAIQTALDWLRAQQKDDGSYAGFGGNVGSTLDTILAVAATNGDALAWRSARGNSLIDSLRGNAAGFAARNAASAGKLALGIAAANLDPRDFDGLDLVISVTQYYSPATGAYGFTNWDQALAILGLVAAGESVPEDALSTLESRIGADGSWGWAPGPMSFAKVDSTGLVLQALIAGGRPITASSIVSGVAFLQSVQKSDGGFASGDPWDGGNGNANSTAFAIQGLLAAGEDPLSPAWTKGVTNPVDFILSLQLPDGSIAYTAAVSESRLMATQQSLPALAGRTFPLASRAVALRKALDWTVAQQNPNGSFAGFNPGATIDAMLALRAGGRDPQSVISISGTPPLSYLLTVVPAYPAGSAAAAGKLLGGVIAAGGDPTDFGGLNLAISVTNYYSPAIGQYGSSVWDQAWSIIGLIAAQESVPTAAVQRLADIRAPGGGWGFSPFGPFGADPDSTGLALMALSAVGEPVTATAVSEGLAYLRSAQNADGGFPGFMGDTSANSTGLAVQGLVAYGLNPLALDWTTTQPAPSCLTLRTAIGALFGLQSPLGGFAGFSGPNDPGATYQAVPGLAFQPFPLRAPAPPVAGFFGAPLTITVGSSVVFTNTSTGTLFSDWDLGDSAFSALSSPTHTYTRPGVYTVTLTVRGPGGSDTLSRSAYVHVFGYFYMPVIRRGS